MTRDCHRLLAIIASKASAESIETAELLNLASWIAPPIPDERTRDWAENLAVPIITELGRRLDRALATQTVDMPQLLSQVREMRSLQRRYIHSPREQRRELAEKVEAIEAEIDELLSADLQPSLFGEDA